MGRTFEAFSIVPVFPRRPSLNGRFNDTVDGMTFFPDLLDRSPDLLALGEPTHGEPAFLQLRNQILIELAGRGYRSIALEIDRVAALVADEFVQGSAGVTVERALAEGFSHDWGAFPGQRD